MNGTCLVWRKKDLKNLVLLLSDFFVGKMLSAEQKSIIWVNDK